MAHRPHRPHNFRALSKPKQLHKREHKHYLPYLPVLLLVIGTFLLSLAQPIQKHGVLAYATTISQNGLLQATNSRREQAHAPDLKININLSAAAQAKANDMIARNYWSHNTPEGEQPWTFISNAGYAYQEAGENLAYGFLTNNETVSGWMNSPTHRQNMLDTSYTEVGFGFANGSDYNKSGHETVVVAMYAQPQTLSATGQIASPQNTTSTGLPINTSAPLGSEPDAQSVARLSSMTSGATPAWVIFTLGLVSGLSLMLLLVKHAAGMRHLIRDSERFVLHHPLLDSILVSLVLIGGFLSQTTGFIR